MTLTIRALGPLVIQADGIALRKPKKARALLVYLAMQDGAPVVRERLADLLWPYQGPHHARHSLRNTLLEVKKSCGRAIDADLSSCGLTASIDVQRFTALARSDDRHDLEAALTLYRGELLEDFDVVSEPWREWQTSEREGLRQIAIHVAQRLARQADIAGEHEQAIRAGKRAVELDGLNEDSHRGLMRAYIGAHQSGAAVQQYNTCEALMRVELGSAPEDETRALRDQCRRPFRRPSRQSDRFRRIAGEFALALERKTKLSPALVRDGMLALIAAADADDAEDTLSREREAHAEPDRAQAIAA